MDIEIKVLPHGKGLPLPAYQTAGSAAMDLFAAVDEPLRLDPGGILLVPTGLAVAIPPGFEFQVRPRSGLALRHGIILPNSPGTIDADYRGEIQVILGNVGKLPFTIERGTRIAQMALCRVEQVHWRPVDDLRSTERGAGGFGHTGC